jgi:hypothetical protein
MRFAEVSGDHTLVSVEQRGWSGSPTRSARAPSTTAAGRSSWTATRARRVRAPAPPAADGPVWLALMHTTGPALAAGGSVFAHPDVAEHLASAGCGSAACSSRPARSTARATA